MVVPDKAVYIPSVQTFEGGIGANIREYTVVTIVDADIVVVTWN